MSITFADARQLVAEHQPLQQSIGTFTVAQYGYQNADVYECIALTADGPAMDAPAILVDKTTGAINLLHGLLGREPAADLTAIGDNPY